MCVMCICILSIGLTLCNETCAVGLVYYSVKKEVGCHIASSTVYIVRQPNRQTARQRGRQKGTHTCDTMCGRLLDMQQFSTCGPRTTSGPPSTACRVVREQRLKFRVP